MLSPRLRFSRSFNSHLNDWWLLSWLAHAFLQFHHTHGLGDESGWQGVAHKLRGRTQEVALTVACEHIRDYTTAIRRKQTVPWSWQPMLNKTEGKYRWGLRFISLILVMNILWSCSLNLAQIQLYFDYRNYHRVKQKHYKFDWSADSLPVPEQYTRLSVGNTQEHK